MRNGRSANEQQQAAYKPTYDELLAENTELKRQLERAQMWESAFAGGVRRDMDVQIEELQKERDELRAAIEQAVSRADWLEHHSYEAVEAQHRRFSQQLSDGYAPFAITWMLQSFLDYKNYATAIHNQHVNQIVRSGNAFTPAGLLAYAMSMVESHGASQAVAQGINKMLEWADHPGFVCHEIWLRLLAGDLPIQAVQRLELSWIKKNLSKRIGTHITLRDNLIHAHKYRTQYEHKGYGMEDYPEMNKASLQKAVRAYDRLVSIAKRLDTNSKMKWPEESKRLE